MSLSTVLFLFLAHLGVGIVFTLVFVAREAGVKFFRFNAGLAATTGDAIVLLNNDTVVPPGAIQRLVRHLDDPAVGLVGCLTRIPCCGRRWRSIRRTPWRACNVRAFCRCSAATPTRSRRYRRIA